MVKPGEKGDEDLAKPLVFMFSGQGSQYYNMARSLFEQNDTFCKWMLKINYIVESQVGRSIIAELYHSQKKYEKFERLLYTHPAIFMVEYSLAQVLLKKGFEPDFVLGSSLGEFTAAALSNVISLEDSIACLLRQAEMVENYCSAGRMLAVFGPDSFFYEQPAVYQNTELVAVNYHSNFVIAGYTEAINRVIAFLKQNAITHQLLPVSFGFHSGCLDPVEKIYKDFLSQKKFQKPIIPFISCLFGKLITEIPDNYFWDVTRKPIQFQSAIRELAQKGAVFLDLGPSGTLANFVKYNLPKESLTQYYSIITPFGQEIKKLNEMEIF
ncbi:MAG: acyltransferase domain-containing protein [Bacillota bacterium]